ncbi:putative flippase GtrA [Bosea sp. OAE506]|uniref:GtrA family protein n=1 Tax=Bosea sp. OAE506 TaxID=2663870 RepID=UPI00178B451F
MSASSGAGEGSGLRGIALFIVNGLLATGVHYATLMLLLEVVRVPSAGLANGMASIVGIAASYVGNRLMVFRSSQPARATLPRFLLLYASLALFHAGFLALWSDRLGLPYGWGFIVSTGLATVMSYLGNRYFVFAGAAAPGSQA